MTTIAFRDGVMAADTQATGNSDISRVQKVWRLPDGGVAAFCGLACRGYAGVRWLIGGERGDAPNIEGSSLLIARPDGSLWLAEGEFPEYPLLDEFTALGCGRDAAVMAMRRGDSAVEAVMSVCGQDAMTSAPVQSMEVVPLPDFPGLVTHNPRKRK